MTPTPSTILAVPDLLTQYAGLIAAAVIVVVGLLVIGLRDLMRFSAVRVWAVSGVCFTESIRKRVLWVTPLAILAVVLVAQFQKPVDELDAIRQTTKFCLFATGMLVALIAVLLAATNLPKEIENRVIFTVVTKPTTRLEIVLGKVVGFARVSAAVLLIMGVFTYGYLHLRAWTMAREVRQRLDVGAVEASLRPTLEHYASGGLLSAKEFYRPVDLNFYSRVPEDDDAVRWTSGASEQSVSVPFEIPVADLPATSEEAEKMLPLRVEAEVAVRRIKGETAAEDPNAPATTATTAPATRAARIPYLPGMEPDAPPDAKAPAVAFDVLDKDFYTIVNASEINKGSAYTVASGGVRQVSVILPNTVLPTLHKQSFDGGPARVQVSLRGMVPGYEYGVVPGSIRFGYGDPVPLAPFKLEYQPAPAQPGAPVLVFRGRMGNRGLQLRGDNADAAPVAVFRFRNQDVVTTTGDVPVELRTYIERSSDDGDDRPTTLQVQVLNRGTNVMSPAIEVQPENGRTVYANLPAAQLAGGNFDLVFRSTTPGAWVTLNPTTLGLVAADRSFGLNLFKSLFILWLLAILIVTVAVFCSTFLSWPIAVVLTVVILLGRWGVVQLGDALTPGIGRQVVTDFRLQGSAESEVVSRSVEALARSLTTFSAILPDLDRFAVTEDIERGVWIPLRSIADAGLMLLLFGLPLLVLSYVIFRNKEVAP